MVNLDQIAEAAASGEALELRALVQEWLQSFQRFDMVRPPITQDPARRAIAASLVEMFADRAGQAAPSWAADVLPSAEPLYLLREAKNMKRLRKLCEEQSPIELRRRHIYATPNFLEFA